MMKVYVIINKKEIIAFSKKRIAEKYCDFNNPDLWINEIEVDKLSKNVEEVNKNLNLIKKVMVEKKLIR